MEIGQFLKNEERKKQEKKSPILSTMVLLAVFASSAAVVHNFVEKEIAKQKLYSEVYTKADKDANKTIDYKEAYNLGKELNVIQETNTCTLTSFDEIFKNASLRNISNYIKN